MSENLPRIHVIATGGTIEYRPLKERDAANLSTPWLDISELLGKIPQVSQIARVTSEQIFQIGSTSITDAHWLTLLRRVAELSSRPDVDGIVISHGTDTMEETAFFLNLTAKTDKPIVLTGAMRQPTALCPEGLLNLVNAILAAVSPQSRGMGVLIEMDEHILAARDAIKCSTYQVGAFQGTEYGCIGKIVHGRVTYAYAPVRPHTLNSQFDLTDFDCLPQVDIIYGYSGCGTAALLAAAKNGAEGIVYAGTGSGILHPDIRELYKEKHDSLPLLVRASRVYRGGVALKNYIDDDIYQSIAAEDFSPQKARILLKLALTETRDLAGIREIFDRY